MDYVYSIDLSSYINNNNTINDDTDLENAGGRFGNKCAFSNRNVFAFSNDCYLYLLPLEKPNELIPITLSSRLCTHLVWSEDGQYLLSAFTNQAINIYQIKVIIRIHHGNRLIIVKKTCFTKQDKYAESGRNGFYLSTFGE
jgi:WD40 repeat protein